MILVVSLQFAGVGVERDDRVRVEVVARTGVADPRAGVAGAPVGQVQVGVERARHPHRRPAGAPGIAWPGVVPRLAGTRDGVGLPDLGPGVGVERRDEAADAPFAARDTHHHLAVDDQRGHRHVVAGAVVLHRLFPHDVARDGVERDHERVGGGQVDLVVPQPDPAAGRVNLLQVGWRPTPIPPAQLTGAGVHRHHLVLRRGDEHHAVVDHRRRLVPLGDAGRQRPDRLEPGHVLGGNLVERAVAPAGVGSSVHQPVVRRRVRQALVRDGCVVGSLLPRGRRAAQRADTQDDDDSLHVSHLTWVCRLGVGTLQGRTRMTRAGIMSRTSGPGR